MNTRQFTWLETVGGVCVFPSRLQRAESYRVLTSHWVPDDPDELPVSLTV